MGTFQQHDQEALLTESPIRVLFVDDDVSYLELCVRQLARSNKNYFIDTAESIMGAIAKCAQVQYDCLLVDYRLPDGNGTDIIKGLTPDHKYIPPTIILTAEGGEEAATNAIRAGATDFIAKRNVNRESLARAINHAVTKERLRESVRRRNEELNIANEQLKSGRREIMRFYHTVSHEVKTPLAAAREFVSLIRDGAAGPVTADQLSLTEMAIESCDQIKNHFTELLSLTMLENGKLQVKPKQSLVLPLVSRCMASASELAREKGVQLVDDIENRNEDTCYGDPERIVQVLSNLVCNAVKFTDSGGQVKLTTRIDHDSRKMRFAVQDSGCGISEEDQLQIFDRLYQVSKPGVERNGTGLGLGLSIAREIIQLHDSSMEVKSEPGVGSTFSFILPCKEPEQMTTEVSPS